MGTTRRITTTAIGVASVLGVGVVAATWDDGGADVRTTGRSTVHASADALERRALAATPPPATCDPGDFMGSADGYERQFAGCAEPVVVFYGSPDSVERQADG